MAHLSDQYTTAATELLIAGEPVDTVLKGLQSVLENRKHESLYPLILARLLRELPSRLKSATPQVTVTSPAELERLRTSIEKELRALGAPLDYTVTYDDSLIGGTVVQYGSTRIDNSYKHSLKHLYKHIITS